MPVAIKTHLHNVCAKNNYELLIAQEPAESARSDGGGARETFARWVLVCADGGTALNHRAKKKKINKKNRFEEPCVLIPGSAGAEASISTAQKHFPSQMKLICRLLFFSPLFPLCLALLLFIFADGEMEGIWELLR